MQLSTDRHGAQHMALPRLETPHLPAMAAAYSLPSALNNTVCLVVHEHPKL